MDKEDEKDKAIAPECIPISKKKSTMPAVHEEGQNTDKKKE